MVKFGLVTITYNSESYLDEFIRSLNESVTNFDFMLIVVDNASRVNPSKKFSDACDVNYVIKLNDKNVGVSAGNNIGAMVALENSCDYIVFLNNDISFGANVLNELFNFSSKNQCIVTPRILCDDSNGSVWFENGRVNALKGFTGEHCLRSVSGGIQEVQYMPTCFAVLPASLFSQLNGFDEDFFVYFDDTDFMFRARKSGYKLLTLLDVNIIHRIGGSTGGVKSDFTAFQTAQNRLVFLRKHKPYYLFVLFTPIFVTYYFFMWLFRKRSFSWLLSAIKGTRSAWNK